MKLASLLVLVGAAVTAAALVIYFNPAVNLPFFEADDGPKLGLAGLGAGWAFWGTIQAWRLGESKLAKAALAFLLVLTLAAAGIFSWHALALSHQLPPPSGLKAGERPPEFNLTDQNGKAVTLESLKGKRVVLGFYQWQHCPWCAKELKMVQGKYKEITDKNGAVVYIAPISADESKGFAQRLGVEFPMLGDADATVVKSYGVLNTLYPLGYGVTLGRPAVFFLNSDGTVANSFQTDDFRVRLTPEKLMEEFEKTK